jgi:Peptidase family M1 domain/Peptidase M1 N-terminal domain/Secretion system C-terminal sorting domain
MNIRTSFLIISLIAVCFTAKGTNTDTRSDSIDIINTRLSIDVADFTSRVLHGHADITFAAKVSGINYIKLDLLKLTVDSVKVGNSALTFSYNDSLINISLISPLSISHQQTVSVYYHGAPIQMPGDFGGFYWDNLYAFNIGVSFLAEPHNYGKVWFPCFDNFVERSTYQFAITTDSSRRALCNGRQDSVVSISSAKKIWYWTMADEIPSYLASISVSNYAVVRDTFASRGGNTLPIWLAARPSDTTNLKRSFAHLKNALSIFENRFGPYTFNKVGYCLVPFTAGAMEHATNISYMLGLINGNTAYENVMAHELSHHWFGDMATCDNEKEMWMNEGWARYCEEIFYEVLYGRDHYTIDIRDNHEDVIRMAHISDSAYWAPYAVPSRYTYSNYSVYEKGADRVHTLRSYMGDSLFFSCMKGYLQHYKLKDVNSYKMRDYLVSCSGISRLNDFFTDWIFDGGFPDFSIEHTRVNSTSSGYEVGISIRQRSDHTSHYFTNVPLEIAYFDSLGNKTVMTADVSSNCTQYFTTLPFNPIYIALDFDEKLSDAVTDQWFKMAGVNRQYDFGVAKMTVNMAQSSDSTLVRVEHHWVAPDASKNVIPGLHLSDYRYWNVDGIWSVDFLASATVNYNGSTNAQGYLDNTFITNSEDSLVLMYRPDAESIWQIDTDAVLNTGGSKIDKLGFFTINNLQKGQYALAIYDAAKIDSPQSASACAPLSVQDAGAITGGFKAYPNPMHSEELNIEVEGKNDYIRCVMINMIGDVVMDRPLKEGQNKFKVYMNGLPRGTYMMSLIDRNNNRISKKIQKLN